MRCEVCHGRGDIKAPVFIDYRAAELYAYEGSAVESWIRCTDCLGTGKVPQASATGATAA
jgi:hypothetical protein